MEYWNYLFPIFDLGKVFLDFGSPIYKRMDNHFLYYIYQHSITPLLQPPKWPMQSCRR